MILPLLLVAGAGAGLLALLVAPPAKPAGTSGTAKPAGTGAETGSAEAQSGRVVMGTIALTPGPGTSHTALDKVNCGDIVVAATDASGHIVAKAPVRAGSSKSECIYSLKVPAGGDLRLAVQEVMLHRVARKAGDSGTIKSIEDKGAQVGTEIWDKPAQSALQTVKAADLSAHKGTAEIGPLQRNLNAVFFIKAAAVTKP